MMNCWQVHTCHCILLSCTQRSMQMHLPLLWSTRHLHAGVLFLDTETLLVCVCSSRVMLPKTTHSLSTDGERLAMRRMQTLSATRSHRSGIGTREDLSLFTSHSRKIRASHTCGYALLRSSSAVKELLQLSREGGCRTAPEIKARCRDGVRCSFPATQLRVRRRGLWLCRRGPRSAAGHAATVPEPLQRCAAAGPRAGPRALTRCHVKSMKLRPSSSVSPQGASVHQRLVITMPTTEARSHQLQCEVSVTSSRTIDGFQQRHA